MKKRKTIIITGSNAGIGLATAEFGAAQGHRIILACRNPDKAEAARQIILDQYPDAEVEFRILDLSSFDSIRNFSAVIAKDFPTVDVLVNNAGVFPLQEQYSREGFEMQFGVNYLGHFLLTHLLIPVLEVAPEARIIHMSSIGHFLGRIRFSTFTGRRFYFWGIPAYAQSKLANVLFSQELVRRLPPHITSNAVHPGYVDSEFFRNIPRMIHRMLSKFLVPTDTSARFTVNMALSDDWRGRTGEFVPAQGPLPKNRRLRNLRLEEKLYEESCRLTGIDPLPVKSGMN